jgi:putative PEP-CTERM system TPR-repeat lipoprotein
MFNPPPRKRVGLRNVRLWRRIINADACAPDARMFMPPVSKNLRKNWMGGPRTRWFAVIGGGALSIAVLAFGVHLLLRPGDLLRDARTRLARGEPRAAQLDLDLYLKRHPRDPAASFWLGLVDLAQDNGVAAERNLRIARDGGYDAGALIVPLGHAYILQRRFEAVLADFVPGTGPPDTEAHIMTVRAMAYLGLHQDAQAREAIARAVQLAPTDADAGVLSAHVDFDARDLDDAAATIARVVAANPDRDDARLLQADITLARGDAPAALREAQSVLAASPARLDAKLSAARALAALQRDTEAVALLDEVRRAAPRRIDMRYLRAIIAVRHADYATAETQLDALGPTVDALPLGDYLLAVTKLALNQPAQAQEAASAYQARHPEDPQAAKVLAMADIATGQPANAVTVLQQIIAAGHQDPDVLSLQARALSMRGDLAGAAASLGQAAALAPANTEILNRLAATRLRLGDQVAGADALRQSLAAAPGQPEAASALVHANLAAGDIDAARHEVDRLVKATGQTETTGLLTAEIHTAALDQAGARHAYEAVLQQYPASRGATFGLIQMDRLDGDAASAQRRLAAWLQAHPADPDGLAAATGDALSRGDRAAAIALQEAAHEADTANRHITETLARLYIEDGKPQRAVALLNRQAGTDPGLMPTLAEAQARAGNPEEARRLFLLAAESQPKDPTPRLGLIDLYLQTQAYDGARVVVADGLQAAPGNPLLLQAAVTIEQRAGGLPAALAKAASLQTDPKNLPAALFLAGNLLSATGDQAHAAGAYLESFHKAPSSALALDAAIALARSNQAPGATSLLTNWVQTHPDDVPAMQMLVSLAFTAHQPSRAANWLAQILARSPNNAVALNNQAWVKLAQNDTNDALKLATRAYIIAPGPDTQDTLGWIMIKQGNTNAGLPLLRAAAEADPSPALLYHEAAALHAAARDLEARAALDRALADHRPFDDRDAAVELRGRL